MRRLALFAGAVLVALVAATAPAADEPFPETIALPNGWQPEGIARPGERSTSARSRPARSTGSTRRPARARVLVTRHRPRGNRHQGRRRPDLRRRRPDGPRLRLRREHRRRRPASCQLTTDADVRQRRRRDGKRRVLHRFSASVPLPHQDLTQRQARTFGETIPLTGDIAYTQRVQRERHRCDR